LVIREGVGSEKRSTQIVVGEGTGVLVQNMVDKTYSVLRQRGEDVVVAGYWVSDVAEGELPFGQPKSQHRVSVQKPGSFTSCWCVGAWPAPPAGGGCCSISSMKRKRGHQCRE
jgi:hypothetical protein